MQKRSDAQVEIEKHYRQAKLLEHESYVDSMVLNSKIYPNWIECGDSFWYVRNGRNDKGDLTAVSKEFRLVDAKNSNDKPAFDHNLLAKALSKQTGKNLDPKNLPITQLKFSYGKSEFTFFAFNKLWKYSAGSESCKEEQAYPPYWLVSPDGTKAVYIKAYNLWVKDLSSGVEHALTDNGERYHSYGGLPERMSLVEGFHENTSDSCTLPQALWSYDSKQLFTYQLDERQVLSYPVTQYIPPEGSVRPKSVDVKYALPNDQAVAEYRYLSIDVESKQVCIADYPCVLDSLAWQFPFISNLTWWSTDNKIAYFIDVSRRQKKVTVVAFDTNSGSTWSLFEESSNTKINLSLDYEHPASLLPLPETNELIWFSERSGWAHLYLYCLSSGTLKNVITHGDWLVREVLHFNPETREVYLQIAGRNKNRNPYYRELCRVNIDTGHISTIASDDYDFVVYKKHCRPTMIGVHLGLATTDCSGVSPTGNYIVTTKTRADAAPITELIDVNGCKVMTLETADISGLQGGWHWPEPVKLLAADGKTDIYGLVFRPSHFSPDKSYPVIDFASNNPFYALVPNGAFGNDTEAGCAYMSAAAIAELGFITVIIDGRGSCYRSKSFQDHAYGNVHTGSDLKDHIAGIRQLGDRYSELNLDAVGIVDINGSNSPLYGLLAFPEFYKVGAVVSMWDPRLRAQADIYHDLSNEDNNKNSLVLGDMASRLQGKLLLANGMLDPVYPISGCLQFIEALVRNNKDFDLVLLPSGGHSWDGCQYALRRVWDFLVCHFLSIEPPKDFHLASGTEYALAQQFSETVET